MPAVFFCSVKKVVENGCNGTSVLWSTHLCTIHGSHAKKLNAIKVFGMDLYILIFEEVPNPLCRSYRGHDVPSSVSNRTLPNIISLKWKPQARTII